SLGIFFTPKWVVNLMLDLVDEHVLRGDANILEPACGGCQFLLEIVERMGKALGSRAKLVGVEINRDFQGHIVPPIKVVWEDYLLWKTEERFDLIVGNPPYGIPSMSDHYAIKVSDEVKAKYKRIYETWFGKYNVYGAFIEKSVKLLKDNGQLVLIVPATFMILDEFKKLRAFLASRGKTEIIYMGGDVFKPEANVTTVILKFTKDRSQAGHMFLYDYEEGSIRLHRMKRDWKGEIILFSTPLTRTLDAVCRFKLADVFDVKISPRTPEIRRSKYVINSPMAPGAGYLPILNSRNLKVGEVIYEPLTGYWIAASDKTTLRKFFKEPRIVMALGFRGNRRIAAAYDHRAYPWMGDVYHLVRRRTLTNMEFDLGEDEIVEFLNSLIVGNYVRDTIRDITFHFNITLLKLLPMPTREELRKLKEMTYE
ncbi:MAG: N-6 DNA methylase, partial [Thermotogae bacterium]|nr:N-6 DNA methylase [Thermotogota bacterium]